MKRGFHPLPALDGAIGHPLPVSPLRRRRRRQVTEVSLVLLSLMQDLQQHRGLSGTLLDGEDRFRGERAAVAEKLQRSLTTVADQFGDAHAVFRGEPWRNLLARWEALGNNWTQLDFITNLSAHSELVLGLVEFLGALARSHVACLGETRAALVEDWPALVEHQGMLRAIGLHLIAADPADPDPRVDVAFRHHLHELRSALASVTADGTAPTALLGQSEGVVGELVALRQGGSTIEAPAFLALTTDTIDAWYHAIRTVLHCD